MIVNTLSNPNTTSSPNHSRRSRGIRAGLGALAVALLASCDTSQASGTNDKDPVATVETVPANTPDMTDVVTVPETTPTSESAVEATNTTDVESTDSTEVQPNEEFDVQKEINESLDEAGFPSKYIDIPEGLSDGDLMLAFLHNFAVCMNYCESNPELAEHFMLPNGESPIGNGLDFRNTLKEWFGFGSDDIRVQFLYETEEDAEGVVAGELGETVMQNDVHTLSLNNGKYIVIKSANGTPDIPFEAGGYRYTGYYEAEIEYYNTPDKNQPIFFGVTLTEA